MNFYFDKEYTTVRTADNSIKHEAILTSKNIHNDSHLYRYLTDHYFTMPRMKYLGKIYSDDIATPSINSYIPSETPVVKHILFKGKEQNISDTMEIHTITTEDCVGRFKNKCRIKLNKEIGPVELEDGYGYQNNIYELLLINKSLCHRNMYNYECRPFNEYIRLVKNTYCILPYVFTDNNVYMNAQFYKDGMISEKTHIMSYDIAIEMYARLKMEKQYVYEYMLRDTLLKFVETNVSKDTNSDNIAIEVSEKFDQSFDYGKKTKRANKKYPNSVTINIYDCDRNKKTPLFNAEFKRKELSARYLISCGLYLYNNVYEKDIVNLMEPESNNKQNTINPETVSKEAQATTNQHEDINNPNVFDAIKKVAEANGYVLVKKEDVKTLTPDKEKESEAEELIKLCARYYNVMTSSLNLIGYINSPIIKRDTIAYMTNFHYNQKTRPLFGEGKKSKRDNLEIFAKSLEIAYTIYKNSNRSNPNTIEQLKSAINIVRDYIDNCDK